MPEEKGAPEEKAVEYIEVKKEDGTIEKFDAKKIENVMKFRAEATQKTQQVSKAVKAAEAYGLTLDDFVHNAEASMELIANLVDQKIIDERGSVIKETPPGGKENMSIYEKTFGKENTGNNTVPIEDFNALKAEFDGLKGAMNLVQKDAASLMARNFAQEIKNAYPHFEKEHVQKVLSLAFQDKTRGYMEIAKDVNDGLLTKAGEAEQLFAKKYGVNIEEYNKKQQMAASGGAAAMFTGKKVTFNPTNKDTEVSTLEAVQELMEFNVENTK